MKKLFIFVILFLVTLMILNILNSGMIYSLRYSGPSDIDGSSDGSDGGGDGGGDDGGSSDGGTNTQEYDTKLQCFTHRCSATTFSNNHCSYDKELTNDKRCDFDLSQFINLGIDDCVTNIKITEVYADNKVIIYNSNSILYESQDYDWCGSVPTLKPNQELNMDFVRSDPNLKIAVVNKNPSWCGIPSSVDALGFRVKFKVEKLQPDLTKGQKCKNGKLVPICGWNDKNNNGQLDTDEGPDIYHCGFWYDYGLHYNSIVCTHKDAMVECTDENFQPSGDVSYCRPTCVNPKECWFDEGKYTACVDKRYTKYVVQTSVPSGPYVGLFLKQYDAIRQCYDNGNSQTGKVNQFRDIKNNDFRTGVDGVAAGNRRTIIDNTIEFCQYGCSRGACNNNTAPILKSVKAEPTLVKKDDRILVTSVGYDKDSIINETTGKSFKEPVRLFCGSQSCDIEEEPGCRLDPDTGDYICDENSIEPICNPDLCKGKFAISNPNCTIIVPWNDNGNKTVYCWLVDKGGKYSNEKSFSIDVDNKKPSVEIISPPDNSMQVKNFYVKVKDEDENGMDYCQYRIISNGVPLNWTNRTCNSQFFVRVPKDCGMGVCRIDVIGFDKAGNNNTDSKTYQINYVFSNITSPEDGSWQREDFVVSVIDVDYSGARITRCYYRVLNTTGVTRDWTNRTCNSDFVVSIGPDKDCNVQSIKDEPTCIIEVRAENNESIVGVVDRKMYKIDWSTPTSHITSPNTDTWIQNDFSVNVVDRDYLGLGFSRCEYKIESKNVTTKSWTERNCNGRFTVTVGSDKDCPDEGASVCVVHVRAISKSGKIGIEDNRTYSILLTPVDDTNGFSVNNYSQTDIGVVFWGVTKKTLSVPVFRVCNKGYTVSECENAFTISSQDCGLNKPCLCGSTSEMSCSLRCADIESQYYLLATGFDMNTYTAAKVISPIKDFKCPFMNITGLNSILQFFKELDVSFSVQIMQLDYLIRHSPNATNETIARWRNMMGRFFDARLLVRDHIAYLENVISDPSVTKSNEAINVRTPWVKAKILEILNAEDYIPTIIEITGDIEGRYRIGTNVSIHLDVEKTGNLTLYAYASCEITKPNNEIHNINSSCMAEPYQGFDINFTADQIGDWNLNCRLYGSIRSDCTNILEYSTKSGRIEIYPFEKPFITNVTSPLNVVNGSNANVNVIVRNPEQEGLYGQVICLFKDPGEITYEGTSICSSLPVLENTSFIASVKVNKLGTWNVTECSLYTSTRNDCAGSIVVDKIENISSFNVIMPSNLYITDVNVPSEVVSGSKISISVNVLNPIDDKYAKVQCTIISPDGTQTLSSECIPVLSGSSYTFLLNLTPEIIGTWRVSSCSVEASEDSECSSAVTHHTVSDVATFNVVRGNNLTIKSISYKNPIKINTTQKVEIQAKNPTNIDRYGYVICSLTKSNDQPIVNRTGCIKFPYDTIRTLNIEYYANIPGTWSVDSCVIKGSLWNDCRGETTHHSVFDIGIFNVLTEFKMYIDYIRVPYNVIFLDNPIEVISDVKNPDTDKKYAFVECAFKNELNETFYNSSTCVRFDGGEKRTIRTTFIANTLGRWFITKCTLNVSSLSDCSDSKLHNTTENIDYVDVRLPELKIVSVTPPQTSLNIGDEAKIYVDVKNLAQRNITAFVNCSLLSPNNITYNITSSVQKIPIGETKTFILSKIVNVAGDWTVTKCAVYKIMSPAEKVYELFVNEIFSVLQPAPPECTINTDCPGTDDKCYCSQNICKPCSTDETCKNNMCKPQPQCVTDADCPTGYKCQVDTCIKMGTCSYDSDCPIGYKCQNYNCVKKGECVEDYECERGYRCINYRCEKEEKPILDQNAIIFIIIIIIVLLIPFLIFAYMKRSI